LSVAVFRSNVVTVIAPPPSAVKVPVAKVPPVACKNSLCGVPAVGVVAGSVAKLRVQSAKTTSCSTSGIIRSEPR
ncbi:MAG: hypothetical protein K8953_03945, partial [Proteobacteria bacterium]|nr:hypothetical protein [Pseudomonadota bacterium]